MNGTGLKEALSDVRKMMKDFGQRYRLKPSVKVSTEEKKLRVALIQEETKELLEAIGQNKLDKIADGIADAIVVILGTAVTYGIPIDTVWDEVMETNMTKTRGPVDPITGKKLKPPGWMPPDIKSLLKKAGWNDLE